MSVMQRPFYPIIYVRGYAMTQSEIEATVSTPYMGFNLGSTKTRQNWEGKPTRHIFESPLVRLMKDYGYQDIYLEGREKSDQLPAKSIIIYRYYEQGDRDLGTGQAPSMLEAAKGLGDLILQVRDQVCGGDKEALGAFKVYLVAHSMGGLVCRCFLQNPKVGTAAVRRLVDKVFTYASPHNGIDMAGFNIPGFLSLWDMNNFNRTHMAEYLNLPKGGVPKNSGRVDSLNGTFDPHRFFCLVGTNHRDYAASGGMARLLAGEMSDGLVKIEHASVQQTPRAFVYRTHSGPYGIVNSEEGYQNLVRFLFGDMKVEGKLLVEALPLPPSVQKAHDQGREIRASYLFEATVSPRGSMTYKLTERRKETFSAVLRKFDELLRVDKVKGLNSPRSPMLFSVFLSTKNITVGNTVVFTVDVSVSTTGYEINGFLFLNQHLPGENLYRNTLTIRATPQKDGWSLRYNLTDDTWGEARGREVKQDEDGFFIPLESAKGFKGKLYLIAQPWNE